MFLICYNSKWSNDIEHSSFLFRCLHRNTFNLMINSEKNRFRCMNLFHVCRKSHIFSTDSKWFLSVCVRKSVTFNIYSPIQKICKNYYSICKWMIAEKIVFGKKEKGNWSPFVRSKRRGWVIDGTEFFLWRNLKHLVDHILSHWYESNEHIC